MSLSHLAVADAAWRWVLDQVHDDDGPWIPERVGPGEPPGVPAYRDGMHSGIGGLAHALAEIRLAREWTGEEADLARRIEARIRAVVPTQVDCTFFDGLGSAVGVLAALGARTDEPVARLGELAEPDGWPQTSAGPPRCLPGARVNDATLGTGAVLLAALWARRQGLEAATPLAGRAADVLLAEGEPRPTGTDWRFVPRRFLTGPAASMPNFSHGLAGIATALALAGVELDRPDLVDAARSGAEHLVSLGRPLTDADDDTFVVPRLVHSEGSTSTYDGDEVTHNWCHGGAGTSLVFLALDRAGVAEVAGAPPLTWHRRSLTGVRRSGLPARLHPGFWDNDGRCCGTAGVADVFLDSWQRGRDEADLAFAVELADDLVDRAVLDGPHAFWRFTEHRNEDPLLPPAVGWMQGAAGIAAYLFRVARVLEHGPDAPVVARTETWWAVPEPTPR